MQRANQKGRTVLTSSCYKLLLITMMCLVASREEAAAFSPTPIETRQNPGRTVSSEQSMSALHVLQRGSPSKTARESAFNVEWEPMTELERRIEDGVNYDHFDYKKGERAQGKPARGDGTSSQPDEAPTVRGVFCGYRSTTEEYQRLKSANP